MKTTDQVNYNATLKLANDYLNVNYPTNLRKEASLNVLGLLMKVALKTSMRVSDILSLEYSQFVEDRLHPNTFILTYRVTKSQINNTVPVGADLMYSIQAYRSKCLARYGYVSNNLFYNYQTKSLFTRVWASNNISKANKLGLMGQVVNVAGTHSLRKTAVNKIFDQTQDLKLAKSLLGHKNINTTSHYLKDEVKSTQDKLREVLC